MIKQRRAKLFAKALYQLGYKQNKLQEWLDFFLKLSTFFYEKPNLYEYFASPLHSFIKKQETFKKIFSKKIPQELLHFIFILFKRRSFSLFYFILDSFKKMTLEKLGIIEGSIITSIPLESDMKSAFEKQWTSILNKKILFAELIDPKLLGGGVIHIGNKQIDFSLKRKLLNLRKNLSS